MGKPNRKLLDKNTGERLLVLLNSEPEWSPTEVSWEDIPRLGLARPKDTISIWISGSSSNPQLNETKKIMHF